MAGTGIGIGYAIFHSNKETPIVYDSIDDVVVTSNVINDKQTHLEKENDIMHFKFTLKNAMLGKTNLSINVNSEYENYFSGQGKILSFTSSDGTPINNVSTEIYVYFEPGEISKDIYIKQTATNTLSNDGYAVVSLEIYANYEDSNGNDDGKPIEENCSIYLYKDSEPVNTAPMVTNLLVKFQDAFDGGKFVNNSPLDFSVLCNYIGETFTNLPKLDNDKIVFNLDDNFNTVLGTLKCYDNAESMASTIISDYALSISGTDKDHYDS
ncbi:hypothetical protein FACS189496_3940 [Bacilli bacterium]|nr:hypothetical protein FACS189496_3940 [Bacilli bacterium]